MIKKLLLLFFVAMNIYTFITVKIDKQHAIDGEYRTSEVKIVALSSLGAAPGTLIGFKVFNHKTNKSKKGYLWDALNIVLVQNILMYIILVFSGKRAGKEEKVFSQKRWKKMRFK